LRSALIVHEFFLPKMTWLSRITLPICLILTHGTSPPPQPYARWTFWGCREHQMWNDKASEETYFTGRATLFSAMEKVSGQVHSRWGGSTLRVTTCRFRNNWN
jgi:hypothetical protein